MAELERYQQKHAVEARSPTPAYRRTLTEFREIELITLYRDICGLVERPKSRAWFAGGGILLGAALGGLFGLYPLFSTEADHEAWLVPTYIATLASLLIVSVVCFCAGLGMRTERVVSVSQIRESFEDLMRHYEIDPTEHQPNRQNGSGARLRESSVWKAAIKTLGW